MSGRRDHDGDEARVRGEGGPGRADLATAEAGPGDAAVAQALGAARAASGAGNALAHCDETGGRLSGRCGRDRRNRREGAQVASDDVSPGDPDDPEPAACAAWHRDHEDCWRLPRRDRPRGDRHGSVPLHGDFHPARHPRLDAPDQGADGRVHRVPLSLGTGPRNLSGMRRAPDVTPQGATSGCTTWAVSISSFNRRRRSILRLKCVSSDHRCASRETKTAPGTLEAIVFTPFERSYALVRSFGVAKNGNTDTVPVSLMLA